MRRLLAQPILRNVLALSWLQLATFVVPLVTLPYLGRTLGPDGFGLVVLGQGLSYLVTLVLDFGFTFSATRDVAAAGEDRDRHGRTLAAVYAAKAGLSVVAAAGVLLAWLTMAKLRAHPEIAVLAWTAGVAQAIGPAFWFVGVQRMGVVAGVTLATRIGGAALTFVLVRDAGDAGVVLALYAAAAIAGAVIVTALAHRTVPWQRPRARPALQALRDSWTLFAMQGTLALYTSANVVLLGLVASTSQVAHFGAADRIVRAGTALMGTVMTAAFPRLTALVQGGELDRAVRLTARLAAIVAAAGLSAVAVVAVVAHPLVRLVFGPGFAEAADVLQVLVLIVPLLGVTSLIGGGLLVAMREDAAVLRIVLTAGVTNVVLGITLAARYGPVGMAVSVVLAEAVALLGCLVVLRRRRAAAPARAVVPGVS